MSNDDKRYIKKQFEFVEAQLLIVGNDIDRPT